MTIRTQKLMAVLTKAGFKPGQVVGHSPIKDLERNSAGFTVQKLGDGPRFEYRQTMGAGLPRDTLVEGVGRYSAVLQTADVRFDRVPRGLDEIPSLVVPVNATLTASSTDLNPGWIDHPMSNAPDPLHRCLSPLCLNMP